MTFEEFIERFQQLTLQLSADQYKKLEIFPWDKILQVIEEEFASFPKRDS